MKANHAYELLELLGQGGFGTVYRARFHGMGGFTQLVALKMLHGSNEGRAEVLARLRDEARVLGLLHHRAIVRAFRLVQLADRWAIVMEYVAGVDLRRLLNARGSIPPGPAFEICAEVAGALHAAYRTVGPDGQAIHLLHRDLKPPNIQLTPFGEPRLLDFGIVHATFSAREAETQSAIFGSLEYMAPERFDRIEGPEGDVYSLGATLYELLTGEVYGQGPASDTKLRRRLAYADEVLSRRLGDTVEPRALILQMLDPDPSRRPSAREVERAAQSFRGKIPGPPLRDWAEQVVGLVLEEKSKGPPDPLIGRVLEEVSEIALIPTLKPGEDTRWEARPLPRAVGPAAARVAPQAPVAGGAATAAPVVGGGATAVPASADIHPLAETSADPSHPTGFRPPPPPASTRFTRQTPAPLSLPGPNRKSWDATPSLPVPDNEDPEARRFGVYGGLVGLALLLPLTIVLLVMAFRHRLDQPVPPDTVPVEVAAEELPAAPVVPPPEPTPPVITAEPAPVEEPPAPEPVATAAAPVTTPVTAPVEATPVKVTPPVTPPTVAATPVSAPPSPRSAPRTKPARPSPEPAASAAPSSSARTVRVVGLNGKVVLTNGTARYAMPAAVPPGTYTVEADPYGQGLSAVARATVPEGTGSLVLRCNTAVGSCVSEP